MDLLTFTEAISELSLNGISSGPSDPGRRRELTKHCKLLCLTSRAIKWHHLAEGNGQVLPLKDTKRASLCTQAEKGGNKSKGWEKWWLV